MLSGLTTSFPLFINSQESSAMVFSCMSQTLEIFKPVETALELFDAIIETSPENSLRFNPPPYEYENHLMPFDILSGDSGMRECLVNRHGSVCRKREVES